MVVPPPHDRCLGDGGQVVCMQEPSFLLALQGRQGGVWRLEDTGLGSSDGGSRNRIGRSRPDPLAFSELAARP